MWWQQVDSLFTLQCFWWNQSSSVSQEWWAHDSNLKWQLTVRRQLANLPSCRPTAEKKGVDSVWPLHPTMGAVCEIKPCQRIQSKVANLTVPSTFPCCRWAATSLCAGCSKLCRVQISNFKYMCSITDIVVAESKSVTYPALLDWICCDHIIQFKCLRPTAAGMGSSVWLSNLHHWCYLAFGAFGEHTDCSRIG